ncbi:MAG: CrcB family protein [Puniceicoccales bacterium]|jgi:CrcB protein|nr:CrcB family protein [Puniceicoccales bacterium]
MSATQLAQWLALTGAGGGLGAMARAALTLALPAARLPLATLLVNAAGSLAAGAIMARLSAAGAADTAAARHWHAFLMTGFCGGFTTFSAFSWQTLELLQRGDTAAAGANIALSLALCLAAVWLGFLIARP